MFLSRIAHRLYCEPWQILPDVWRAFHLQFQAHIAAPQPTILQQQEGDDDSKPARYYEAGSGVAIHAVQGVIGKHLSLLESMCGGYDLAQLGGALEQAKTDPNVRAMVLYMDSPGGIALGLEEAGRQIRDFAAVKPIVTYTDAQCCSAAYHLAASTDAIYAAPSATIGSISTYIALVDESEAWAKEGLKLELFRDGKYKGMGLPGKKLEDHERAFLQDNLEKVGARFKAHVKARRPGVKDSTMQGQWFMANDTAAKALVDGTADDLSEIIAHIMQQI